ncbi:MAG: zf-HC2 domain-containing protein [Burkholderiales bacterium]
MKNPEKLTCRDLSVLVSQARERDLSALEHMRMKTHLAICEACRNFQRQMNFLDQLLRRHRARNDEEDEDNPPQS